MNLSQALKQKNRLAGELVRQQQILTRENARRNDSASRVNCEEVFSKILQISDELGTLKGKIAIANIGIYPMLERMAELKSRIIFLQNLPKREGADVEIVGRDNERFVHTWTSYINQTRCDEMIGDLQAKINDLQDKIDYYNSVTLLS